MKTEQHFDRDLAPGATGRSISSAFKGALVALAVFAAAAPFAPSISAPAAHSIRS